MTLSDGYEMRTATDADVPTIVAMRDAVGWRAHPWAVRAVLRAPRGRLLCVTLGESVVAVGSGVAYGALGVVGNMIVAAEHRRRGLGSAILRAVMRFLLDEAGCRRLELYATPEGRPLYIRHGFGFIEPAAHAPLPIVTPPADGTRVEIASAEDTGALAAYDAPRFGGDRSSLIEGMAADVERPLLMARRDGALAGYAWLRPDDARLGPFVADDPSAAEAIVAEAQRHVDDPAGLSTNIPTTNGPGVAWLESLGAELDPWDGRMARGPAVPRRDETIYGSVVGALG